MNKLTSLLFFVLIGASLSGALSHLPESIHLELTFKKPVELDLYKIDLDDVFDEKLTEKKLAKKFPGDIGETESKKEDGNDESEVENEDLTLDDIAEKIQEFRKILESDDDDDDDSNDDDDDDDDDDDKEFVISEKDILELLPKKFHVKEVMERLEGMEFKESDDEFKREYGLYTDEEGENFFLLLRKSSKDTVDDFYFGLHEDESGVWALKPSFERSPQENFFDSESIGGIEHDKVLLVDEEEEEEKEKE